MSKLDFTVVVISRGDLCHSSETSGGELCLSLEQKQQQQTWLGELSTTAANTYGTVELTQAAHAPCPAVTHYLPGERQQS